MRVSPRKWVVFATVLTITAQSSAPAWGWGARGHRIATRVAEARLSPAALAGIRELLLEGDTLAEVSTWADTEGHAAVPASAPWHYVNVPIAEPRYDAKFCPKGGCVVSQIKHFRAVLADRKAPRRDRQRALLFLVHFVEDVHQPLHVGDNRDRGGNLAQVQFFGRGTNLHKIWDTSIIDRVASSDRAFLDQVEPLVTPENVKAWSKGSVEDWADESLKAARRAYHFPEGAKAPLPRGSTLGADYETFAAPIIRERIAQAGVRLANELNAIFK